MCLPENCDFESLCGYQVSFYPLLQIRGQIRVKCHFVRLTLKKCKILSVFVQKFRFLSPYKVIRLSSLLLPVTSNKGSNKGHISFWPIKGSRGPRSIFTFLLFLIEENGSYQAFFSELKDIVPSQSY